MNRLESIKEALAEYKADEDLLSPPERGYLEDVEYLLQRLERYETALQYIITAQDYDDYWPANIAEEVLKEE